MQVQKSSPVETITFLTGIWWLWNWKAGVRNPVDISAEAFLFHSCHSNNPFSCPTLFSPSLPSSVWCSFSFGFQEISTQRVSLLIILLFFQWQVASKNLSVRLGFGRWKRGRIVMAMLKHSTNVRWLTQLKKRGGAARWRKWWGCEQRRQTQDQAPPVSHCRGVGLCPVETSIARSENKSRALQSQRRTLS